MIFDPTYVQTSILLYARDITSLLLQYTHIKVSRSPSSGPWYDVTEDVAARGELQGIHQGPYRISGRTLVLQLSDATRLDHIFTTDDPVSAAHAAGELNLASPLLNCTVEDGYLILRTTNDGTGTSLKILGGDACHDLGFYLNDTAFGKDEHILLVAEQVLYHLVDQHGDPDYGYSYRFINPPLESERRITIPGQELAIDLDQLAVGHAHLTGLDGMVSAGVQATIANRYVPPSVSGHLITRGQTRFTDTHGDLWFPLIRGAKVEFSVSGTPLHRIIEVPDVSEFDLLDPTLVQDDPWGIIVYPYTSLPKTAP